MTTSPCCGGMLSCIACRETAELRLEDRHLGAALLRVLAELELTTELFPVDHCQRTCWRGACHGIRFRLCALEYRVPRLWRRTYAWAWAENQVLAAVKLIPLGQSAGQRMLHALNTRLDALVSPALGRLHGF